MTRLTVISHACILPENQKLWLQVAAHPEISLTLIAPQRWQAGLQGGLAFQALPELEERCLPTRVYWPGRAHIHTYSDLGPVMTTEVPDVVYLDEDAHSLVAAQVLSIQAIMDYRLIITLKQNVLKRYPFPFSFVEKRTYRLGRQAAATSEECLEIARTKGYKHPAEIIGYPIDTELFHPAAQPPAPTGALRVGYAGRFVVEKGVTDLVAGVAAAQRQAPVHLSLAGNGPEHSRLEAQARKQLQAGTWDCPGLLHGARLADWYRSLDVLVLPSRTTRGWQEQFGRVLAEAMACGLPVIGSSSGYIPTLVMTTGGGEIYSEGDVEALSEGLLRLAGDPARRRQLGETGRASVVRQYSLLAVADKIVSLVLSRRPQQA